MLRTESFPSREGSHPTSNADHQGRRRFLDDLVRRSRNAPVPLTVVIVYPVDDVALLGAVEVQQDGILAPILVGPAERIMDVARHHALPIEGIPIVDAEDEGSAARAAVDAARSGRADLLMKGSLHTSAFLRAVLSRDSGLRGTRRASHVYVFDVPAYDRPLFVTDAAVNVAPGLGEKADICRNAIDLARALGVERPRVAVLSALEVVDPAVPSTLHAAALSRMADRDEITGAIVDGPLALDDAVNPAALTLKHITSTLEGKADILVAPNLEAGNILSKSFVYMGEAEAAGIVVGTRVPLVLTSRADTVRSRVASAALASFWSRGASGAAWPDPSPGPRPEAAGIAVGDDLAPTGASWAS